MYFAGWSLGHSPFRQWPFSPWSIGCSVQDQKFALQVPFIPPFNSRAHPSVWSVLDTGGQQSLHLFTYGGSPRPLSSSLFCSLPTRRLPDLLQREESRLNISAIGGNFARIQFSIIVHLEKKSIFWVSNSRFVTGVTYGLTGHTLATYPTKILPKAKKIKGIAIRMGAS